MNELRDVFTKYKAVVFFDTETTGLEAESCQIIELAAIRVEKTERGTLRMADSADVFVKLPEGERIPQKIVELTGITDEQLENEGITEAEAAARFTELIGGGRVLLVAHNAQFDLLFTAEMLRRHGNGGPEALKAADYLDSLTVYKDRRAYPHKLANAILTYKLEDKVQNSHRAIDDVAALFEVCKAMDAERSDLLSYVNVFGYNPKYGVSGKRIEKVAYWPQNFNKYMQAPSYTLPAKLTAVLYAGSLYVDVAATAEEGGTDYNNIDEGEISEIVDVSDVPLLDGVTNLTIPIRLHSRRDYNLRNISAARNTRRRHKAGGCSRA